MIKVGVLGAAHVHAPGWARQLAAHPDAELAGVYDPDAVRAAAVAGQIDAKVIAEPLALLDTVDAVVVSTENKAARGLVELAAKHGKPVLCEKPLGADRADGAAMLDACEANGVPLSVTFEVRYNLAARRLKALADSGVLGTPLAVWATNHGAYPGGWFGDPARSGGGCLIDHVVHVADLIRWIWGLEFASVRAEAATRHNPGLAVEDCGMVLATLENGAAVSLDSSWSRHSNMAGAVDVTMQIAAEGGHVDLDAFADRVELVRTDGHLAYKAIPSEPGPGLIDEWLTAVTNEEPMAITGLDGYRASEVAWAALESAAEHRTVSLPLPAGTESTYV